MGLLPDIKNGEIVEEPKLKLYTPPKFVPQRSDDKRQEELNNFGRRALAKDFSDSPHLNG